MTLFHLPEAVLDASMDAVITVGSTGRIERWNSSAEVMFGYPAAEVIGAELAATIVPERLRAAHRSGLAGFAAGGAARIDGGRTETTGRRADGTEFPVELTITRVTVEDTVTFVGYLRDLSERNAMLTALHESRTRLVTVSDEARRRVERDLHDGAQQQLVALAIALGAARRQVDREPAAAAELLDRSIAILATAIEELRELARGVHSEVLTRRGLGAAIAHLAGRSPIDVVAAVDLPERLPTPIETSVYYLVAEAMTNSTKYGANRVWIELGRTAEGAVAGTITDDGPGGADATRGTGLAGMSERLRALGGRVELTSPPGMGTSLRIEVPVTPFPSRTSDDADADAASRRQPVAAGSV